MKMITPISDSIFKKLNEEELLLINELYLDMVKYKNVIDKIKEEIEIFNSVEYNANNFTILSLITRINELLEKVDG